MDREELKALIRTAPTKRDTLAELEPELAKAEANVAALRGRRDSLVADLREVADAEAQLAAMAAEEATGEPELVAPADKPISMEED